MSDVPRDYYWSHEDCCWKKAAPRGAEATPGAATEMPVPGQRDPAPVSVPPVPAVPQVAPET